MIIAVGHIPILWKIPQADLYLIVPNGKRPFLNPRTLKISSVSSDNPFPIYLLFLQVKFQSSQQVLISDWLIFILSPSSETFL